MGILGVLTLPHLGLRSLGFKVGGCSGSGFRAQGVSASWAIGFGSGFGSRFPRACRDLNLRSALSL